MEKKKKITGKMTDYVVIGIGKLGESVATRLFSLGNEVLAIDKNQTKISSLEHKVSTAVATDATSFEVLHSLGVQNFDCAIICISDDLEGSILTAQICKDLGVRYVIATAQNEQHAKILNAINVDLIIFPEEFVGNKLASLLSKPGINELVELTDEFKIFEMNCPGSWWGTKIEDLNLRKKYKLSIVFIKRGNKVLTPEPDTLLDDDDILVVAGESSKINAIASLIGTVSDIDAQLTNIFKDK